MFFGIPARNGESKKKINRKKKGGGRQREKIQKASEKRGEKRKKTRNQETFTRPKKLTERGNYKNEYINREKVCRGQREWEKRGESKKIESPVPSACRKKKRGCRKKMKASIEKGGQGGVS